MTGSNFATLYRNAVKALFVARSDMKNLQELNAGGIVASLPDGPLDGSNGDCTKADLVAAITAAGQLEMGLTNFAVSPNVPTAINLALSKLL